MANKASPAPGSDIDPDAMYDIGLLRPTVYGRTTLLPVRRYQVRGKVLLAILADVSEYAIAASIDAADSAAQA